MSPPVGRADTQAQGEEFTEFFRILRELKELKSPMKIELKAGSDLRTIIEN